MIIIYEFCYKVDTIYNNFSILNQILVASHRNIIIICEYILNQIIPEIMTNPWIFNLKKMIEYYNNIYEKKYIITGNKIFNYMGKLQYNIYSLDKIIRDLFYRLKIGENDYLNILYKDLEKLSFEEINSFFEENILRVNITSGSILASILIKENEYFEIEPAPYLKINNLKPYSLVLDLNQTLIHLNIKSEDYSEGIMKLRPGAHSFLDLVGKYYELIIFSASIKDYVDLIIESLEENKIYFEHRLYRQHTIIKDNNFIKDLTRIGRPLDKTIIVDNMPQNFRLQKENGILIKSFYGEDNNDNSLEELGKILVNIAKEGGDVRISLKKYNEEIIKKVSSNISKRNY